MENRLLWILFVVLSGCQIVWFLRDEEGRSALDHARKSGHTEIEKVLRAAGAR